MSSSHIPTILETRCHRLESQVTRHVEDFFIANWPFQSSGERLRFLAAGYGHSTCCCFPEALDARMEPLSLLLTALSLIKDRVGQLADTNARERAVGMSNALRGIAEDAQAVSPLDGMQFLAVRLIRERLLRLEPTGATAALNACAIEIREESRSDDFPTSTFESLVEQRVVNFKCGPLPFLTRFAIGLDNDQSLSESLLEAETLVAKHMMFVDDLLLANEQPRSVELVMGQQGLEALDARAFLWDQCRVFEYDYMDMRDEIDQAEAQDVAYWRALGYLMSGNQLWRRITVGSGHAHSA